MHILFIAWAGLIPVVPLIGAEVFKKRKDTKGKLACYILFGLQLLLSIAYITVYF